MTAQGAGIYAQKKLNGFLNGVLFTRRSDNTLQLRGKAISYEFMSKLSPELLSINAYKSLRIALYEYMLNVTPFFKLLEGSLMMALNSSITHVMF